MTRSRSSFTSSATLASLLFFVMLQGAAPSSQSMADVSPHVETDSSILANQTNPTKLRPKLDLSFLSYASDSSPVARLSTEFLYTGKNGEIGLSAFYESGSQSFWKFDPDPMVLRSGNFWVGRTHPLTEGLKTATRPEVREALGLPWAQNQIDPLQPKVSGWLSLGYAGKVADLGQDGGLRLNVAYSPLFVPTFSPSLGLSDREGLNPERWARLPPLAVELPSGTLVPIQYRLQLNRLKEILLQNQFFVSTTYESKNQRASLMYWNAPSPNPLVDTTGLLQVNDQSVNAQVTVIPKFPRQNFVGAQWVLFPNEDFLADLQLSTELTTAATLGSIRLAAKKIKTESGFLATLNQGTSDSADNGAGRVPTYADSLFWIQSQVPWMRKGPRTLSSNVRFERHFLTGYEGSLASLSLDYSPQANLRLSAVGTALSGTDHSYYGTWRALDTIRMGVAYLW